VVLNKFREDFAFVSAFFMCLSNVSFGSKVKPRILGLGIVGIGMLFFMYRLGL